MNRFFAALALAIAILTVPASAQEPPAAQELQDLQKRVKELEAEMTAIRGLDFKSDVKVGVYTREELAKFVKAEMERETPREKVENYQKAYQHFGLLPKPFDLYDATAELLTSSIAGFYHSDTKEMRLVKPGEGDPAAELFEISQDMTIVHELCHAAQDQHFSLNTLPFEEENNDDMVEAVRSLTEGDAFLVGTKHTLKEGFDIGFGLIMPTLKKGELPGKAGDMPAFLRKTLTFPYGYGSEFVLAVWRHSDRDWDAVSKMFDDLPASTEQILHPKKYYEERDYPTVITLKDLDGVVGGGWKEIVNNVHGEFAIRLLFGEFKAERTAAANRAAAGWDGDRFVTFELEGRILTVWYSTWDTEQDAQEFFESYAKLLAVKYPKAAKTEADQKVEFDATEDDGGLVLLERRGADVLVIDGADADVLGKANDVWKTAAKSELRKVERVKLLYACPRHPEARRSKPGKCRVCGTELEKKKERKDY